MAQPYHLYWLIFIIQNICSCFSFFSVRSSAWVLKSITNISGSADYLLKFVQCKWKLKWSERNHFAVLLCFPGTAKQMGSKDRIRGTKTSDERMDVERCCVRVAVPKRGEFNPAGRPNAGFGVLWRNRTRCCKRDMKKLDFFLKNLLYTSEGYRGKFKSFKDKYLQGCITSSRPQTALNTVCSIFTSQCVFVCVWHSQPIKPVPHPTSIYI